MNPTTSLPRTFTITILGIVILAGLIYGGYRYVVLSQEVVQTNAELASTTADLQLANDAYSNEQSKTAQLTAELEQAHTQNGTIASQMNSLSTTVESLSKLAATDPELLAKYSKVYFLSDNYVPRSLSTIDAAYVSGTKALQFETDALPFLTRMMDDAHTAQTSPALSLRVVSAYRSFGTQAALKSSYKVTYGAGTANSFSADQGYSEHQLGTTIDFTTTRLAANFSTFDSTNEYAWLVANAYKYGFILSYPKNNKYYVYEPWHWRFVGVKLATMLHAENQEFYMLDQHTINPYLITIFEPLK
jgi:D-alanyl-D-alanine carboxypeptidase